MALVFAHLEDVYDAGMVQPRRRLALRPKPAHLVLVQPAREYHLEGDDPVRQRLACLVDDAHAATSQHPQDLVARDTFPDAVGTPGRRRLRPEDDLWR